MGKFKVGDRVRHTSGLATVIQVRPDITAAPFFIEFDGDVGFGHNGNGLSREKLASGRGWWAPERDLAPAPLFTVGDKVRFKTKEPSYSARHTDQILDIRFLYDDGDVALVGVDYAQVAHVQDIEHASADKEAGKPIIFSGGEFFINPARIGMPTTSGFTIPTDEEALPPKVSKDVTLNLSIDTSAFLADTIKLMKEAVSARKTRLRNWEFDWGAGRITVFDPPKPKPCPAIVALITDGQPLPSDEPKVHRNTTKATKEANRLATRYPGKEFGVFELVSKRVASVTLMEAA